MTYHQSNQVYAYELKDGEFRLLQELDIENDGIYNASLFLRGIIIATNGNGILYYNSNNQSHKFFNTRNSPISSDVVFKFFIVNDSTFWAATDSGIEKLQVKGGNIISGAKIQLPFTSLKVTSLVTDPYNKGLLWIGTSAGLYNYDYIRDDFIKIRSNPNRVKGDIIVNSLMFDNSAVLWIGTENRGLLTINVRNMQFNDWPRLDLYEKTIAYQSVTSIFEDSRELLWIGTKNNGIFCLDFINNKSLNLKSNISGEEGNKLNDIKSIVEFQNNEIWHGTNGAGVYKIKNSGNYKSREKVNIPGLGQSLIRHMIIDQKQQLWIASKNHLLRYISEQEKSIVFDR